ncbi:hypothetical protein pb186bvf_008565 [Paramecium bursaria]
MRSLFIRPIFYFSAKAKDLNSLYAVLNQQTAQKEYKSNYLEQKEIPDTIWQLKQYIQIMPYEYLKGVTETANKFGQYDDGLYSKVYDRAIELMTNKEIKINQALKVADLILQNELPSQKLQQNILGLIKAALQHGNLSAEQAALCLLGYGQIIRNTNLKNKEIENGLISAVKDQIDNFNSSDLRHATLGFSIARIENNSLWELFQRQTLLQKNINLEDLSRIATGFAAEQVGSQEFWKFVEDAVVSQIKNASDDTISIFMSLYKQVNHGNDKIFKAIEQAFLSQYDKVGMYNAISTFSGFAGVSYSSSKLWELFQFDLDSMIKSEFQQDIQLLVADSIYAYNIMQKESYLTLINYLKAHHADFHPAIKQIILERLDETEQLTPELEALL